MLDLDLIESRANRALDGMNFNRDAMARDVLDLCATVRRLRTALAAQSRQPENGTPDFIANIFGANRHG